MNLRSRISEKNFSWAQVDFLNFICLLVFYHDLSSYLCWRVINISSVFTLVIFNERLKLPTKKEDIKKIYIWYPETSVKIVARNTTPEIKHMMKKGPELMNFNTPRQKPKACHTSWPFLLQPLKMAIFCGQQQKYRSIRHSCRSGLSAHSQPCPLLSSPRLAWNERVGIGSGHRKRENQDT